MVFGKKCNVNPEPSRPIPPISGTEATSLEMGRRTRTHNGNVSRLRPYPPSMWESLYVVYEQGVHPDRSVPIWAVKLRREPHQGLVHAHKATT